MKNIILFVICFTVSIFQLSGKGLFFLQPRFPDLALALVVALVLALGFKESMKWILFTGLIIDSASVAVFGSVTLSFFLIGWSISRMTKTADLRSRKIFFLFILALIISFSEIFKDFLLLAALRLRSSLIKVSLSAHLDFFSLDYLFKIFYSIIAVYILYYFIRRLSRKIFIEPVRLAKKY